MPKFFEPVHHQEEREEPLEPKISEAGEVRTLLTWVAPSRPFRKKDRSYYTYSATLVVLLSLVVFFWLQDFLLIAAILSFLFLAYVLATVTPGEVTYKLSSQGITIGEHFYFWHNLDSFWFKVKDGCKVVLIQTYFRFPGQLMLVLGSQSEEEVQRVMARFLPFHEIPQTTLLDRWGEGLQKHFPLENTHR